MVGKVSDKVTFEHKFVLSEGSRREDIWGRAFWEREISKCKGPGVGMWLVCSRNSTKSREAGVEWVRGDHRGNRVQGVGIGYLT